MRFPFKSLIGAGVLALVSGPVMAHHSSVMFNQDKTVTLTGKVKEFQYTNPHSWLLVNVVGDDGKVTTWGFEAEGPSSMMRAGIRPSDLTPGTEITISGHPMKDGRPAATWIKATRNEDGKVLDPHAAR